MKLEKETYSIINCAMEISNAIGHGFHEKIYENALVVEFDIRSIPFNQQPTFPIIYKSVKVGTFIPDLICFDKIVVDTKTIETIADREIGQMVNYLKVTKLELGLIINFKNPRVEWKRVVL